MKNESQSTQQNAIFKSYDPGSDAVPGTLAASVREALDQCAEQQIESASAIGLIRSITAPAHHTPAKVVYEDKERIIVEVDYLSYPLTLEAAEAVSALPYLRVWVEAPTMQDLLMPSSDETFEQFESASLAMAPLFDPAFEPGLSALDSRKVILRITSYNCVGTPDWFWALTKRNVTLKFQQARVDGRTELNVVEDTLPLPFVHHSLLAMMGAAAGDLPVQTMPTLPADIDGLLFPFLAGRSMCTNSEWQPARLIKFISIVWSAEVRGYARSVGSTFVLTQTNSATDNDLRSLAFLENIGTAFCMLHKHFVAKDYRNYPIELLKAIHNICSMVAPQCPMLSHETVVTLEQTLRSVVSEKTFSAIALPNVVEVAATKRRI